MGADLSNRNASDPITAINVTPLVDVCLVLVIIFMVTAPLIAQNGIMVNSIKKEVGPEPKTKQPAGDPEVESIYLKLSLAGLELNGQALDPALLPERMKEAVAANPTGVVYINAEDQVTYGRVVEVLDITRQSGAKKLAMLNDKEGLLERNLIFQKKQ
jgi:biopolymer transport protein TolR